MEESAKISLPWYLLFQNFHWGPNLVLKDFKFGLGCFFRKTGFFPAKIWLFLTFGAVSKDIKGKQKFYRQSCT